MEELKTLSQELKGNQDQLNKQIENIFIEIERLMKESDIKAIKVEENRGEKLVLRKAGKNGDICLCYIPYPPEKDPYEGDLIESYALTPVVEPIFPFPSPSRYAKFAYLLMNEKFQKELVNTFSETSQMIKSLREQIEQSYSKSVVDRAR